MKDKALHFIVLYLAYTKVGYEINGTVTSNGNNIIDATVYMPNQLAFRRKD